MTLTNICITINRKISPFMMDWKTKQIKHH